MGFLVVWLLLGLLSREVAAGTFVVMFPNTVVRGRDFPITVNIINSMEPVYVKISLLEYGRVVQTIDSGKGILTSGAQYLMTLDVPRNISTAWGQNRLRVETDGGIKTSKEYILSVFWLFPEFLFIQTDKGIYKRGQTVRFRVLALDLDLFPLQGPYNIIIQDPNGNRIAQWMNAKDHDRDMFENELIMTDDPVLGDWTIIAQFKDLEKKQKFTIAEYGTLPAFEVQLSLPKYIQDGNNMTGTVSAKYTFGRDVRGTVKLIIRLKYPPWNRRSNPVIYEVTKNITGRLDFEIDYTLLRNLFSSSGRSLVYQYFNVTAVVTDDATHESISSSKETSFRTRTRRIVIDSPGYYKPGFPYKTLIKITDESKQLTAGEVSLDIREYDNVGKSLKQTTKVLPFGSDGKIPFEYLPTKLSSRIRFQASTLHAYDGYKYAYKFESLSGNYLSIELLKENGKARKNMSVRVRVTEKVLNVFYQVYAKKNLISHGEFAMKNRLTRRFKFYVTSNMAPSFRLMMYYIRKENNEMVMDIVLIDVDRLFPNKLILKSRQETRPGRTINLKVISEKGSTVCLQGVDKAATLLKAGNDIDAPMIEKSISSFARMYTLYGRNVVQLLQSAGLYSLIQEILTTTTTTTRTTTGTPISSTLFMDSTTTVLMTFPSTTPTLMASVLTTMAATTTTTTSSPSSQATSTQAPQRNDATNIAVRELFPETWLWKCLTVSSTDGREMLKETLPDTITTWKVSGFALSRQYGFGVTQSPAMITTFLPFFIKLDLPFSSIRGEILVIKVTVFNYVETLATVDVTLKGDPRFQSIIIMENDLQKHVNTDVMKNITVPKNDRVTVYFPITPTEVGDLDLTITANGGKRVLRDAVKRTLLVEPEGVEHEYSIPLPISLPSRDSVFNETVDFTYPSTEVPQSRKIILYATGDTIGLALNNLENLLKMPYGCGEQNMVGFAPDVFITKFLMTIGKLRPEIKTKALNFMLKGYQRQLLYRRYDGSFSAFGNRDSKGSVWLTAFVVKSFVQASSLIDIDERIIIDGVRWIVRYQLTDGSFRQYGQFSFNWLKGSTFSSNAAFTSFIMISLLEADKYSDTVHVIAKPAIVKALGYLSKLAYSQLDVYSLAILSYGLALAGNNKLPQVLSELEKKSISSGFTKHWERNIPQPSYYLWRPPIYQSQAINIETTAYVLLTYTVLNDTNNGYLVKNWLAKQQKSEGGFKSTQDTVIALQALTEYSTGTYSEQTLEGLDIEASTPSGFSKSLRITKDNDLLLQSFNIPPNDTTVTVTAKGQGYANVVLKTSFHVYEDVFKPAFSVKTTVVYENLNGFKIQVCVRKITSEGIIMGILEIGMPTGFSAETTDVSVVSGPKFKKVDKDTRKLIIYFDIIPDTEFCIATVMTRDSMVAKQKSVPVRFYNYYEPTEEQTTFFIPKGLSELSLCNVCGEACSCSPQSSTIWTTTSESTTPESTVPTTTPENPQTTTSENPPTTTPRRTTIVP